MNKKLLVMALIIFIICYLLLTISLYRTNFLAASGILLDESSVIEFLNCNEYYQGYSIKIIGFFKPKIDSIKLIKKNGENFADSERVLITPYNRIGTISMEEFKEISDKFVMPKNFIPNSKVFTLVIKNDSYLRLNEIGEVRIYYSLFGIKMNKKVIL